MLHELHRLKKSYAGCGRAKLDTCYPDYYDLKYDEIIRIAREENPPPVSAEVKRGRKKKEPGDILKSALTLIPQESMESMHLKL